jgi:hypothetical protein
MAHNTDLTPLDLDDAAHGAVVKAQGTLHQLDSLLAGVQTLIRIAEGNIEDHRLQHHVEAIADSLRDAIVIMAHDIADNAEVIAALTAGMTSLLEQRDAALRAQSAVEADWVDAMCESNNWTVEDAQHVLTLLLNSDEDLLGADIVFDSDLLYTVRDQFAYLLTDLEVLFDDDD